MDVSDRLVRLFVARSARLEDPVEVDRHAVTPLPDVPGGDAPACGVTPVRPWDAARGLLGRHGVIDSSPSGEQLLAALLAPLDVDGDELRSLYGRMGLSAAQRLRVLEHPNAPGSLLIEYVSDERRSSVPFDAELMHRQIALLQRASGISGAERLQAWAVLTLRAANNHPTEDLVGDVLIASPNATTVLHAAVVHSLANSRTIPTSLGKHLMSHIAAPATVARVPLPMLFRLIDQVEHTGARADQVLDRVCDLVAGSCSTDPARWSALFELARDWSRSLGELLDEVERPADAPPLVVGGRRSSTPLRDRRTVA